MPSSGCRAAAALALLALVTAAAGACRRAAPADAITIAVPYELGTLDPHLKNSLPNFSIASQFYEPLVTTDAEIRLQPCLARTWENPDPSTWVFHLQKGVRFHDGRPLRAADVVYSIRRLLDNDGLEMSGYTLYISEVEAVDEDTVRLRTTKPLAILLNKMRFVSIVPEGSKPEELAVRPVGTGPYVLDRWTEGKEVRLRRNASYWGKAPAVGEVTFLLGKSPEDAASDLEAGRAQLIQCNSRARSGRLAETGLRVQRRPSLFVKYIGFDVERARSPFVDPTPNPFRDVRVRRAFDVGIDRARLVAGLPTHATPLGQFVPPAIFGFNPRLPPPRHDAAAARALLAEAGIPDGLKATIHVRRLYTEAAERVKEQLLPLGIRLEVVPLDDVDALARFRRREFSLILSRFGAPTGDASDILDNALHSPDPARRMGLQNYGGYRNEAADRAIEDSAAVDSVTRRRESLEKVMALLAEEVPWVPLYVDDDVYVSQPEVVFSPRADSFVLAAEIGWKP